MQELRIEESGDFEWDAFLGKQFLGKIFYHREFDQYFTKASGNGFQTMKQCAESLINKEEEV